jgi:hypothetical protein
VCKEKATGAKARSQALLLRWLLAICNASVMRIGMCAG